jgi:hypothetical protein
VPLMPDVVSGGVIASAWGNQIRDRTIQQFSTLTDLTANWPGAPDGAMAVTLDTMTVYQKVTAGWVLWVQTGVWTLYTPTDTNITVGNGSRSARFTQIGKTVHFRWALQFGSTTALPASSASIGLPVEVAAAGITQEALATYLDNGSRTYIGRATMAAGGTSGVLIHTESGTGNVGTTAPFTWTNGDNIRVSGTYEAA